MQLRLGTGLIPLGFVLVVGLATACTETLASPAAPKPANAAANIAQPPAGGTVNAGQVKVIVYYTGPKLVPAASATAVDQYHLHFLLDVDPTPYIGTSTPIPASDPHIIHTVNTQVTFDNVERGTHQVAVIMTGSNHISVVPPVEQDITFNVS